MIQTALRETTSEIGITRFQVGENVAETLPHLANRNKVRPTTRIVGTVKDISVVADQNGARFELYYVEMGTELNPVLGHYLEGAD